MGLRQYPALMEDLNDFYNIFTGCCAAPGCCTPSANQRRSTDGLIISEDEKNLYIDASLPGIKSDQVEVTLVLCKLNF